MKLKWTIIGQHDHYFKKIIYLYYLFWNHGKTLTKTIQLWNIQEETFSKLLVRQ